MTNGPERQESSGIPQDIQEEFKKFAENWLSEFQVKADRYKVFPEKLLFVGEVPVCEREDVIREYFYVPAPEQAFNRLSLQGSTHFMKLDKNKPYSLERVSKVGEFYDQRIILEGLTPDSNTQIIIYLGDMTSGEKRLFIKYNHNAIFEGVDLPLFHHSIMLQMIELKRLKRKDVYIDNRAGTFLIEYDKDAQVVRLGIFGKKELATEVIRIPIKIDKEKIVETLAPQERFADPYNADPYDDRSWLEADLKGIVGIENEPPKNFQRH